MLQKLFVFLICSVLSCSGFSQTRRADSLSVLIARETDPLKKFDLLRAKLELINIESGNNVDSASCIQLLQIAQKQKNDSLLAISYNWIGAFFSFTNGDNVTALEYFFKGIPLAERAKDKRRLSSLYFDIAVIYYELQDYGAALENTKKGGDNLPDTSSPNYDFMLGQYQRNMAAYFLTTGVPDSALKYAQLHGETAERYGHLNFRFSALLLHGAAYANLKQDSLAQDYFEKASEMGRFIKIYSLSGLFYNYYIRFLIQKRKTDAAKRVAKQYLQDSEADGIPLASLRAAGFLRQVYDSLRHVDSAYYYSRMEAAISDRIFSQENINKIKGLAFQEQLRGIEEAAAETAYKNRVKQYAFLAGIGVLLLIAFLLFRNNRQRQKTNLQLQEQKEQIEKQKEKVESTLSELKSTQSQLIQAEKMASLGQLTAGIAHEIQNPLNFVNNFSEVSGELLVEAAGNRQEAGENSPVVTEILMDIRQNLEKINHHGKRADAIVKGMLQHSRSTTGQKEPTDLNALVDEYTKLAFHARLNDAVGQGFRGKDSSFEAKLILDLDPSIGRPELAPHEIGRVLLNLLQNGFYAVSEKKKILSDKTYEPMISVTTKRSDSSVEITVKDNGNGIPEKIVDKIFQPFFTTKPTGKGTGLGLSLSYDIIKAHGGEIKVNSTEGVGSEFIISLNADA